MPTTRSPSRANATCADCSNERRSASALRPLSKSSARRSAFACSQSMPSSELSIRMATASGLAEGERRDRRGVRRLVRRERRFVAERQRDVVEPFQQALAREVVQLEREAARGLRCEIDGDLLARVRALHQLLHLILRELHRQQPGLQRVLPEDVAERRCDHGVEAVILECPRCVLARRAAAEVAARNEDARALRLRTVQLEARILAPVEEEELAEAAALDVLQELLRDDLVGVDIRAVERDRA